jgi:thioredoxin reductase (NADPH)
VAIKTRSTPTTLPRVKGRDGGPVKADIAVIGAGPTGLACAIEAQKAGATVVVIDKGCLVNSLYNYPTGMLFFTTPELLEIGDIPFPSAHQKPTREEALSYYRRVAGHYKLNVQQYQRVLVIDGENNRFRVTAIDPNETVHEYKVRKVIVATGYYDLPNIMDIPGEDLPKVMHYYKEAHPYYNAEILVIGGRNSAAIAALDLWRHGARVTLVHRQEALSPHIKYWIMPDISNRIKNGEITAYFNSSVTQIDPETVTIQTPRLEVTLKNDFVFALTGYHPDFDFLRSLGVELVGEHKRPVCDPETLETNVSGVYIAGVIVAGSRTSEIFIENGRFHGKHIARHLQSIL